MADSLKTVLTYYGISPWEIEVLYGLLNSHFVVVQDEIEPDDENFVSQLAMDIPLDFNDAFFQWFGFKRWEKIKDVFKEMKRRRGASNALKISISFAGRMRVTFVADVADKSWFNNAMEKIDFVLELLPHHLDSDRMPPGVSGVTYRFDPKSIRWRLSTASANGTSYSID